MGPGLGLMEAWWGLVSGTCVETDYGYQRLGMRTETECFETGVSRYFYKTNKMK